jgi:hypothetical protein
VIPSTPPSTPARRSSPEASSPLQNLPQSQARLLGEESDVDNAREDEDEPESERDGQRVDDEEFARNERAIIEVFERARSELARRRDQSELPTVSQLAAGASIPDVPIDPALLLKYQLSLTLKGSHGRGLNAQALDDAKAWPVVQGAYHADAYRKAITWCSQYPRIASRQWSMTGIRVTADYSRCAVKDTYVSSINMLCPKDE